MDTKAKVAIVFGVVFLIFWISFQLLRESPDEKYERMEKKGRVPPVSDTVASKPDFDPAVSYLFELDATGTETKSDLHDALLAELRKAIAPTGLNPAYGRKAGGGELGTITARVQVETQEFRGQQQRIRHQTGLVPYRLTGTVSVVSAGQQSSWDGTHELSVTIPLPDKIIEGLIADTIKQQCEDLAKQAVDELKKKGEFKGPTR